MRFTPIKKTTLLATVIPVSVGIIFALLGMPTWSIVLVLLTPYLMMVGGMLFKGF